MAIRCRTLSLVGKVVLNPVVVCDTSAAVTTAATCLVEVVLYKRIFHYECARVRAERTGAKFWVGPALRELGADPGVPRSIPACHLSVYSGSSHAGVDRPAVHVP